MKQPFAVRRLWAAVAGLVLAAGAGAPVAHGQHNGQHARLAEPVVQLRQALRSPADASLRKPAAPSYDVVALRVAFQPDTTSFTTGDGTFEGELYDGLLPTVDPLPHDAAYFEAHLAFLEDYVAQASDGKTSVATHLVPDVIRVSQQMSAYSPVGPEADSDAELMKLAALVAEAWRLADAQSSFDVSGFDPARTAFVLFHAGVGRDIELIGTTLDRTPQDLPSLFFDAEALERLLGDGAEVTFNGLPVGNTLILPRTETRRGIDPLTDAPFLAEFSLNGLMAASFFNFLGVPDLFDTATGTSAIGPFGLMDPLGIFAYNGLFPPEPMAWTKYYLGWYDPIELEGDGPATVTLGAAGLHDGSTTARAWLSGAEYFLAETRHRDPEGDGLVLRVWKDGSVTEQRVENGAEDFNSFTVDGFIGGVVVGADTYDWALPGGLDEDGNALLGGMLVWHVDERRLTAGLPENAVNADPERRAIDLEEADSAQDLGMPSGGAFGPQNDLGSPFDFYYEGNPVAVITATGGTVRLYENRLGPSTFPSSDTNEGGPSFVVLEAFTTPAPRMSVTYRREALAGITPQAAGTVEGVFGPGAAVRSVAAVDAGQAALLYGGPPDGSGRPNLWIVETTAGEAAATPYGTVLAEPVQTPQGDGPGRLVLIRRDEEETAAVFVTTPTVLGQAGPADVVVPLQGVHGLDPAAPPVVVEEGEAPVVYVAFGAGSEAALVRIAGSAATTQPLDEAIVSLATAGPATVARVTRSGAELPGSDAGWVFAIREDAAVGQAVFGRDAGGVVGVVPVPGDGQLLLLQAGGEVQAIDLSAVAPLGPSDGPLGREPVLSDLDEDGRLDVVATWGAMLVAFTQNGAVVDGLPIRMAAPASAQPLVAAVGSEGRRAVLVAAADGYVYAYEASRRGELAAGYPLAVGASVAATPLLQDQTLMAISEGGSLRTWQLGQSAPVGWGEHLGGPANPSFTLLPGAPPPAEAGLLVATETYNWPNPIRDGTTYLRYQTTRDARVRITVVDGAGSLIDAFTVHRVAGGTPAETLWQTDAASGVYYARITATAEDGASETRLVKMAVIR